MTLPKYIYAANREIGYNVLKYFLSNNFIPSVLLIPENDHTGYSHKMRELVNSIPYLEGTHFRTKDSIGFLKSFDVEYFISVHFPYIITKDILAIPSIGTINLHPSFLPYNKGWHTPTWAIYEKTPFGATLHWVDEGIDTGDIILQKEIKIEPDDTAHTLYQKAIKAELEIMKEALPLLISKKLPRQKQQHNGTAHVKGDIEKIRNIDLNKYYKGEEIVDILRCLTTNNIKESAYFIKNGKKYLLRIEIYEEK